MSKILNLASLLILYFSCISQGQNSQLERGDIRVMFYNTENFFDTIDDPHTNDNEFLPGSQYQWNKSKYYKKIQSIYQVIAAVGEERPPEIIGLSEIENRKVLNDLIFHTPIEKYPYKIIHKDSPDPRGIDVALLYRSDMMKCIGSDYITICFPGNKDKTTRDILYFKALINNDTLHVFVNHWPSRRGGQKKSDPSRSFVAGVLKQKTDSIFKINPNARIVITGDFNDEPCNRSIVSELRAIRYSDEVQAWNLYNLSWNMKVKCKCGTYRHGYSWEMLDQFIVSGTLLMKGNISTCPECNHIGEFKFLLNEDNKYGGYRPFRTYQGPAYKGGFSDHLPVYLDIYFISAK
jgi:hypothetical protein